MQAGNLTSISDKSKICDHPSLIFYRTHLNDNEAKKFFSQLVNAVCFLHSKNILHRDIKLTNILLTDKNDLKLADFGLSAQLEYEEEERFTMCGTPNFIAP